MSHANATTFVASGCEGIILGCTEIELLLPMAEVGGLHCFRLPARTSTRPLTSHWKADQHLVSQSEIAARADSRPPNWAALMRRADADREGVDYWIATALVPDELALSGVWSTARTHRRLSAKCPQLLRGVGAAPAGAGGEAGPSVRWS